MRSRRADAFLSSVVLVVACAFLTATHHRARATTAVVFDVASGKVLHAERADKPWYPASLTKLMSAYVAFDVVRSSPLTGATSFRLSEHANSQEPTKLWLRTGTELTLATVLGAMIVKSANDAAVMLAEGVGGELARFTRYGACITAGAEHASTRAHGSPPHPHDLFRKRISGLGAARYDDAVGEWTRCRYAAFIVRMNATAKRLGMTRTTFANANGLPDPRQVTTARDLGFLARALIHDFPDYAHIFATRSMRYKGGRLRSYNALLRTFAGADGMKTGFVCASGYNIVASATRGGRRVVAVVLGWSRASHRNTRAANLMQHAFRINPTRFGPHDVRLAQLDRSGHGMTPPEDIRASLTSRSCRRGPGWRMRFRARKVAVRALEAPQTSRVPSPVVKNARGGQKVTNKKINQPKPKRVTRKRRATNATRRSGKRKAPAKSKPSAGASSGRAAARAALSLSSQR